MAAFWLPPLAASPFGCSVLVQERTYPLLRNPAPAAIRLAIFFFLLPSFLNRVLRVIDGSKLGTVLPSRAPLPPSAGGLLNLARVAPPPVASPWPEQKAPSAFPVQPFALHAFPRRSSPQSRSGQGGDL